MITLLVLYVVGVSALALVVAAWRTALYRRRLSTCEHPLPGSNFPFVRCMYGECYWCDSIAEYSRIKPRPHNHPYRTVQENE